MPSAGGLGVEIDLGLGHPGGLSMGAGLDSGLGSPFNTPTTKRVASNLRPEGVLSPPFSTPRRARPRGLSLLNSPAREHKRKVSVEGVMARIAAAAVRTPAIEAEAVEDAVATVDTDEAHRDAREVSLAAETTEQGRHIVGLGDLPIELIQTIHMLADNPGFPHVSRYLHNCLTHASETYIARYMLYQYRDSSYRSVLTIALKRPIVTLPVAEEIIRLWDQKRGFVRFSRSPTTSDGSPSMPSTPSRPRTTAPPLEVTQLPRRIFRPKPAPGTEPIHPLVRWLFKHWDFNLKTQGHYPLARSVINQNYDLVEFLLRRGADPNRKEAFALTAAIEKKDLRMVKLLVEPFDKDAASPAGKRRKVTDRVTILPAHVQHALTHGTPEIVEYFVHEKGAMPSLGDIMALGSDRKRRRYS